MAKQNVKVEAYYGGDWHNLSAATDADNGGPRVRLGSGISIERGASGEDDDPPAATCRIRLSNRDGWADPFNPASELYGVAGRNMPVRVWAGPDPELTDAFGRSVSNSWSTGTGALAWSLSGGTVPDDYDVNGSKGLQTHPAANVLHYSTVDTGQADGRYRAVFNLSAGTLTGANASVWVLGRFTDVSNYYAALVSYTTAGAVTLGIFSRVAGTLTALVGPVTTHTGYGGLFASRSFAVDFYVEGDRLTARIWDTTTGEPYGWNLTVSDSALTTGNGAGVASRRETGNTNASLAMAFDSFTATPGATRIVGEVSSWKPGRTLGDTRFDAWTDIVVSGITRRLGQGTDPILPAHDQLALSYNPRAYWPLDDLVDSQQARTPVVDGVPMVAQVGSVDFTDERPPGLGGSVRPSLVDGNALVGQIEPDPATTSWAFAFWFKGKAGEQSGATTPYVEPVFIWERGNNVLWFLRFRNAPPGVGEAVLVTRTVAYSGTTAPALLETGTNLLDEQWHHIAVFVTLNGGTGPQIDAFMYIDGNLVDSDSDAAPSAALGMPERAEALGIEPGTATSSLDMDYFNMAGLTVVTGFVPLTLYDAGQGYPGESTADRFTRITAEQGIPSYVVGDEADTRAMGPQWSDTLMGALREIAATDNGILVEPRHERALALRTGRSRFNLPVTVTLDYGAGYVVPPFEPNLDDLATRNDVSVQRREGSTYRAVQESGPLNVNDPASDPDGVGRTSTQLTRNPELDADLPDLAGWALHLGTVPEERYGQITVELGGAMAAGIVDAVNALDIGDRVAVVNVPNRYGALSLLVLGYQELILSHTRQITFNLAPERPWRVLELDSATYGRLGIDATTTAPFTAGTSTSMTVSVPANGLITTAGGDMPFDIVAAGVRLRVTAVAGASSPQTLTVSSSIVSGPAKVIPTGTAVELYEPPYLGV